MRVWCSIIFCFVMVPGCVDDAPRDNPLDPLSPKYTGEGSLTGQTIIVKRTIGEDEITGAAGVNVYHVGSGIFVTTDSAGYFAFNNLPEGMQSFICTKENFTNDTFQVSIHSQSPASVVRWLNGAPVVLTQSILARRIEHVSFSTKYFVDIEAEVSDPNGNSDLDSVWFNVADTMFFPMDYSDNSEKFFISLDKLEFPTGTIQWLTNRELHIVSRDESGNINKSAPFFIPRIIENSPTPLSPTSSEAIPPDSLVMRWKPPDITFNYTSTVTVINDVPGNETVVLTIPGVISFYEQYPFEGSPVSLEPGKYYWTVTIVDDFGNYSRSKESYFIVPPPAQ